MRNDEHDSGAAFELAAGWVAVIIAACLAASLFKPAEQAARSVVMAIGAAVLAATFRNWRSIAGVTVLAALVFVGFLAHHAGELTGTLAPWRYTLIIVVAAFAGRSSRAIRNVLQNWANQLFAPLVRLHRER